MNPRLRVLVRMVGSKQRWRVRKRPTALSFDEDGNTVVNPARAAEGAEDVPTAALTLMLAACPPMTLTLTLALATLAVYMANLEMCV